MSFEEIKDEPMKRFEGRKAKGKLMKLHYIFKYKRKECIRW